MIDKQMNNLHFLSFPDPYHVSVTDHYYGVPPSYEETKTEKMKVKNKEQSSIEAIQSKKLRILITTFWDYPAVGGLQNYISTLKIGLEKLGHIVDVIAPNQFPRDIMKEMENNFTNKTEQFYNNRYGCSSQVIVKQNVRLASYEMMLRNMNLEIYDIFHAQDRFTANVLGRINRYYQKPLLFTPHGFMTHRRLQFNLLEKGSVEEAYFLSMDQKATESSNHMIILCEAFRPLLKNMGVEDSKMTTIYTGLDFNLENTKKTAKDKTIITCVSRLRPRKGHKYLFEALALLESALKNVEVWIVGDGEMKEQLEAQVNTLQLDNVFFLGARTDVPELLNQSDIFVLPTTSDTLPISIIEAMFAEKAIITTNCGGILEIIKDQHSGLIVEQKNALQLSEKLSLLLRDSSLRETLAQNAKAFANKHLTSLNMVKKTEEIYQSFQCQGEKKDAT